MKNHKPERNVEYTFAFDNGNLTFKYMGDNANGGYIMKEVKRNVYSKMSVKRFSYLYEFALVGEKNLSPPTDDTAPSEKKPKPKNQNNSPKVEQPSTAPELNKDEMLSKVLALTDIQNKRLFALAGKDKTDIATDIENYFSSENRDSDSRALILKEYNLAIRITTI